jgi:ribosomal protein S18 acetylase RimI-like enzyme
MSRPSSSDELYRQHGFSYRVAREEHGKAMARLLGASFAHEPMAKALGLTAQELEDFAGRFMPECTTNELSVIAVPEEAPHQIAGVFMNRDFKAPLPAGIPDEFPRFGPIIHALVSVDEAYEAQVPGLQQGQAVDLWMVGVEPSGRYARRGIARNLFQVSSDLVRDRGYQRCVTECTGNFSQRAAVAAGFQEKARVLYKELLFEGRPVFASIPEPHVKVVLYERLFTRAPGR